MKYYTKQNTKLLFTVKLGSDVSDLIEIKKSNILNALKDKGLSWVDQLNESCFSLVLVPAEGLTDNRIENVFDIAHDDELSSDCSEVFSL